MLKAILFAVVFIVLGMIVFAFVAPLLFRGANMQQVGAAASPIILLVCGALGFFVGWRKRKKSQR
jgi:predicted ABC-type sugar transport system permease subunit